MAQTTHFGTEAALLARLSQGGLIACADDNGDGVVSESERVAAIEPAKAYATAEINAALRAAGFTTPITQDDASLDEWLQNVWIDLALHRLWTRRGVTCPETTLVAFEAARKNVEAIATRRKRVPTFVYPGDTYLPETRAIGRPTVANGCRTRRR